MPPMPTLDTPTPDIPTLPQWLLTPPSATPTDTTTASVRPKLTLRPTPLDRSLLDFQLPTPTPPATPTTLELLPIPLTLLPLPTTDTPPMPLPPQSTLDTLLDTMDMLVLDTLVMATLELTMDNC